MSSYIYPKIIQGGMGVSSDWCLPNKVSSLGQLGTVSGVTLEKVVAMILQFGDIQGHIRRALASFPFPNISRRVLEEYYVVGGIKEGTALKRPPFFSINPSELLISLTICANYAFVWLAKNGHKNPVSINFLEKIAMPHLYAIFGAMLAGVDFVTMGAGIPRQVPAVLDNFSIGQPAEYRIPVCGQMIKEWVMRFNPSEFFGVELKNQLPLKKPGFIPIISSNTLAEILTSKCKLPVGSISGFVVERNTAGGHNARPRKGDTYGEKDEVNFVELKKLGLPFWIGGSYASPEKLKLAISLGAEGIQVGSIFALCEDSSMEIWIRQRLRSLGWKGELRVRTDRRISSSGFPFKVAELDGTISEEVVYQARRRVCEYGALVSLYEKPDGTIGYRCPGEPVTAYRHKGGKEADTVGRGCLCSGLITTARFAGRSLLWPEPPVVTIGDDLSFLRKLMVSPESSYTAEQVINYLLGNS